MTSISLLPQPRSITYNAGQHRLKTGQYIQLQIEKPSSMQLSTRLLQTAIEQAAGLVYPLWASSAGPTGIFGIILRKGDPALIPAQGYTIRIEPEQVLLEASTSQGIFYGVNTLAQIISQSGNSLPCLEISDWPDFLTRGYMLDISRDKVPEMTTILGLIDQLASWKINQLQLYTEHTFAYLNHPQVWQDASPLTGQDILELDRYCQERFIELVPNQNTFGHMHRWLQHPAYAELSEVTDGFLTPWGYMEGTFSLDPTNPESFKLVSGLFDELLPHFTSRQVNIGCDETFDLGQGKSKPVCDEQGKDQVYLAFLSKISQNLSERGYTVQFWGDIILQSPELIPRLPKNLIALDWGYEADHPFELEGRHFEAAGIPFYVCPGTAAWCSLAGRTDNAIANLISAAEAGLKHRASGYLITDWGDRGHWQPLSLSYLGLVTGAALAWSLESNRKLDIIATLDRHVFKDKAGVMGKLAFDLGNVYRIPGLARHNGSELFWLLQYTPDQLVERINFEPAEDDLNSSYRLDKITAHSLLEALAQIEAVMAPLDQNRMELPSAGLVEREYRLVAGLMRLACWRGLMAMGDLRYETEYSANLPLLLAEYSQVWLNRNRPGGLVDSLERLEKLAGR